MRARRVGFAHIAQLPALVAAGRVAPRPRVAVGVAAIVVVADARGSRAGCTRRIAVAAGALALHFPRQARKAAPRLAHGAAVV